MLFIMVAFVWRTGYADMGALFRSSSQCRVPRCYPELLFYLDGLELSTGSRVLNYRPFALRYSQAYGMGWSGSLRELSMVSVKCFLGFSHFWSFCVPRYYPHGWQLILHPKSPSRLQSHLLLHLSLSVHYIYYPASTRLLLFSRTLLPRYST